MNNAKTDLDLANSRKMEEVMLNTDMVFKSSLNFLQEKIDENLNLFSGSENLQGRSRGVELPIRVKLGQQLETGEWLKMAPKFFAIAHAQRNKLHFLFMFLY